MTQAGKVKTFFAQGIFIFASLKKLKPIISDP